MSYFIIIRGPAGVGKTTIAKILKEKLAAYYISFDDVLDNNNLVISDGRGICLDSFLKANRLIVPEAIKILSSGGRVVFDGCFYHKKQIDDLISSIPFPYFIFDLKALLETCIQRDIERKGPGRDVVKGVYKMVSEFGVGHAIESEGKSATKVAGEILIYINKNA